MDETTNAASLFDQCSFIIVRSVTLDDQAVAKVMYMPPTRLRKYP